ncbi:MAG TPA: VOC family protein [Rhodanobacteraceae bacterium]|nr:VOC family protein [Rhodanobacteraceae bacterium]
MIKLDHLTIAVRDYKVSREWYVRVLGLKVEFEVPERAVALQDDAGFTLFLEQAPVHEIEPSPVLYFQVDDVHATHHRLQAIRVDCVHPPERRFWGYGMELKDPDGYRLRLWDEKTMQERGGA